MQVERYKTEQAKLKWTLTLIFTEYRDHSLHTTMMYKATLTFSLLFLAVVGSAQNDGGAGTSAQPPSNLSSPTPSNVYPSGGIPTISTTPTASDGNSSQTNKTRPSGCYPHDHSSSAIPTDQPLSASGVFSSAAHDASHISKPHFRCEPDSSESNITIPTGTASVPQYSGDGALPLASTNVSRPIPSNGLTPNGTHHGNSTLPTGSPKPSSSGTDQQGPPSATATTSFGKLDCLVYSDLFFTNCSFLVGRRMLVRRQF
jgi:hypothetical protein